MKNVKKIAAPFAVLAFSLFLTSRAPAAANEPKQMIKQFFEAVQKNDVDGRFRSVG